MILSRCMREDTEGKECKGSFPPVMPYHRNGGEQQQYMHNLFLLQKSCNYLKTAVSSFTLCLMKRT